MPVQQSWSNAALSTAGYIQGYGCCKAAYVAIYVFSQDGQAAMHIAIASYIHIRSLLLYVSTVRSRILFVL